jgi:hypothetical protein
MHKVRGNYSSCTGRSSENICNSSGGAQEKGKTCSKPDETQFGTKSGAFLSLNPHRLNANVLFCRFFKKSHPVLDQTQGTGTDFTENSIEK